MIRITVSGNTYDIRKLFNDQKFQWDSLSKTWSKIVAEGSLDKTLDAIRPPGTWSDQQGPQITVTLHSVDVQGNELNNSPFKLKLMELARSGVSVLEEFRKELSGIHGSPIQEPPGPSNPKKEPRRGDDYEFY